MKPFIIFVLFPTFLLGQKINYNALILPATLSFCSGATWGLHEKTSHHWGEFSVRFPKANPQFWNPEVSWRNKYVGGNPDLGRKKILGVNVPVHFSDAKHLLASSTQVFGFSAGCSITLGKKVSWKEYALRVGASFVGYSLGNYVTFNLLYK